MDGIPNSIEAPAPKKNPILSAFIDSDIDKLVALD